MDALREAHIAIAPAFVYKPVRIGPAAVAGAQKP
jgi:hypothetical protein